jgi:small subunit ribosomal protein S7
MSRRARKEPRGVPPDVRYNSVKVNRFIRMVMHKGKMSTAISVVYGAFELVKERSQKEPLEVFEAALQNVGPQVEVKPRRVGGATYQVPVEVEVDRRDSLAVRWILTASRARSGKSMIERLAGELLDAANNTGTAVKKREEVHKMAEANRAYAHYRW